VLLGGVAVAATLLLLLLLLLCCLHAGLRAAAARRGRAPNWQRRAFVLLPPAALARSWCCMAGVCCGVGAVVL
jgi:hypothetical protein